MVVVHLAHQCKKHHGSLNSKQMWCDTHLTMVNHVLLTSLCQGTDYLIHGVMQMSAEHSKQINLALCNVELLTTEQCSWSETDTHPDTLDIITAILKNSSTITNNSEIYLQTYRHDMTYSVLKVLLNHNQPTLRTTVDVQIRFKIILYKTP